MQPAELATSFDTLRAWDGSQARAFEELSYQLLKQDAPVGTTPVRTGNPDGGVEWYATLNDGSEWGWQAKHVHGIANLLTAMETSVRRVVRDRPQTVKLTFIVSWNLATSTRAGERKSQRQKYEDAVDRWKRDIPGAERIDFALNQGSELLDRLSEPEHRGRAWFWWHQPVFTPAWLDERHSQQREAAGERYRPDLQVDLPIQLDIEALGYDDTVVAEFEHLRQRVVATGGRVRLVPSGSAELVESLRHVLESAAALTTVASETILLASTPGTVLATLQSAASRFLEDADTAETIEVNLERRRRDAPRKGRAKGSADSPEVQHRYGFNQLRDAARALDTWLQSPPGSALRRRLYFLTGAAGSGKTHLFLDAVRRALDHGRPALVLPGGGFGRSDLWASICDQLGLGSVGADTLLGAMDSAAEASGRSGRRFVLLIDALNETTDPDFWRIHLPALRAAIVGWPHVALALSCRDTYLEVVDDGNERAHYEQKVHPGFAGREVEATQRYFDHYGLEAPRIPLLVPEFSVPLFLRMYCESLAAANNPASGLGHEGRVHIFERYLSVKLDRVARRIKPSSSTAFELSAARQRARRALDSLLDELARTGREAVTTARCQELVAGAVGGLESDANAILGAFESEGVLSRELLYLDSRTQEGFRILFQAFADFLILTRRLVGVSDPKTDAAFRSWLLETASWGVGNAAAVVLPESYGIELPDALGLAPSDFPFDGTASLKRRKASGHARRVYRAVVETLPYRESSAITDRTVEILNATLRVIQPNELYAVMFQIAPQPGNRFNAEALHRHLVQLSMPQRDSLFGIATYSEIGDESSPAATLARWASRGPYPDYDPQVVELAAIPLIWLLSSPNRYMRDWVTKALVQLLRGHLDVTLRLLNRFWSIDDPYVVQRLVVVIYGALMRWRGSDIAAAHALSARVRQLVFTKPVRADELLFDAARGVVEWAVAHRCLPQESLDGTRHPYGLGLPAAPPSEGVLKNRYGYRLNPRDDDSYNTIWFSIMDMGDFGRYVIEPGLREFSRYRRGTRFPARPNAPHRRFIKRRWAKFVDSLKPEQTGELTSWLEMGADGTLSPLGWWRAGALTELSTEQEALFASSWSEPKARQFRDDDYPGERAKRWILWRTVRLGWRPKLFGTADQHLGYGRGRDAHKAERWGKKYQWMAYHELLARVADNYQPARNYDDAEPYDGLQQLIGDREIDPSVPPLPYRDFIEHTTSDGLDWGQSPIAIPDWPPARLDFARYQGNVARFVADRETEPTVDTVLRVKDSTGCGWIMLDAFIAQGDPAADETWRGLQQPLTVQTVLAPSNQATGLSRALLHGALRRPSLDVVDTHGHIDCCFAGEVGWGPRGCSHFHRDFGTVEVDGSEWRVAQAVERVTWEAGLYDCSTENSIQAVFPSSFMQARSSLLLDERGPSWTDGGEIVLANFSRRPGDRSNALLARADWLQGFLHGQGLELVVILWHERWAVHDHAVAGEPWEEVTSVGRLDQDLQIHVEDTFRQAR